MGEPTNTYQKERILKSDTESGMNKQELDIIREIYYICIVNTNEYKDHGGLKSLGLNKESTVEEVMDAKLAKYHYSKEDLSTKELDKLREECKMDLVGETYLDGFFRLSNT